MEMKSNRIKGHYRKARDCFFEQSQKI